VRSRLLLAFLLLAPTASPAQDDAPASLRLYVMDGGTLVNPDPSWANLTLAEMKGYTSIPVPAYLIVHPDGMLLWDTGLGDGLLGRAPEDAVRGPWTQVVTTTVREQLAEIGYSPGDIDYIVLSHAHFDHAGNANDYAAATWIVQRTELGSIEFDNAAQWGYLRDLRNSQKRIIDGDHDVFGDGRVVLKYTPGHTPGHQSLYIALPETGPIVLSGDLYHLEAHRRLQRIRLTDFDRELSARSRASLEQFLVSSGADLWIQHELMLWATLKKAPLYYD
jgi:glyoxylase-like metal-dependent hydrolase (beta-lactamase superfamily II)